MKPIKIERVIHYEGGLERRSIVECDEECQPVKPDDMPAEASAEWDRLWSWFDKRDLSHIIDGPTLRDHCLSVKRGKRDASPDDLGNVKEKRDRVRQPKKKSKK